MEGGFLPPQDTAIWVPQKKHPRSSNGLFNSVGGQLSRSPDSVCPRMRGILVRKPPPCGGVLVSVTHVIPQAQSQSLRLHKSSGHGEKRTPLCWYLSVKGHPFPNKQEKKRQQAKEATPRRNRLFLLHISVHPKTATSC